MPGETIIENLKLVTGWEQRPDDFSPCLSSAVYDTDDIRPYQSSQNQKFVLEVKVGIEFWANQAQLPSAIDTATRAFAKRMYGDIDGMVHEVMLQISNGDREAAYKACGRILEHTKGVR